MTNLTQKKIGLLLIVISIVLITILSFVKSNIDSQEAYLCEISHSDPNIDISQCPAHTSNSSWLILVAFGFSFLLLAGGIYLMLIPAKLNIEKSDFKEIDTSKLDEDEKKIYGLLKQNEGSMYQSDLIKETELSKVAITRILDKLESKKIIDRKRRGMTNIVILR